MILYPWMYLVLAAMYGLLGCLGVVIHSTMIVLVGCLGVPANLWMALGARKFYNRIP